MDSAKPLQPQHRAAFLRDVADELQKYLQIGKGLIGRVIRDVQRRHFDPPSFTGVHGRVR